MSDLTLFQSKKVRGENGPGCWAMRPVEGHPDRCLFQWLLDTDIKVLILRIIFLLIFISSDSWFSFQGWIPQSIIDKALSGTQFEYIANIRARARVLRAGQMLDSTVASCSDMAEGAPPTP